MRGVMTYTHPDIQYTIDLLIAEIVLKKPNYISTIKALAAKLVLQLTGAVAKKSSETNTIHAYIENLSEGVVQRAVLFLLRNFSNPISINDVVKDLHLSRRQLERLFRKTIGSSIIEYLTNLRVDHASQLLMDPHLSIKEIAYQTGFSDTHYFSSLFRRQKGMTPSIFREKSMDDQRQKLSKI